MVSEKDLRRHLMMLLIMKKVVVTWHDNFFSLFEYETPKVVTVHKLPLGIFRRLLQLAIISFVVLYQLWYMKGYQEFADVEASLTTKVKGLSL